MVNRPGLVPKRITVTNSNGTTFSKTVNVRPSTTLSSESKENLLRSPQATASDSVESNPRSHPRVNTEVKPYHPEFSMNDEALKTWLPVLDELESDDWNLDAPVHDGCKLSFYADTTSDMFPGRQYRTCLAFGAPCYRPESVWGNDLRIGNDESLGERRGFYFAVNNDSSAYIPQSAGKPPVGRVKEQNGEKLYVLDRDQSDDFASDIVELGNWIAENVQHSRRV